MPEPMTPESLAAVRERWKAVFLDLQHAVRADPAIMRAVADVPALLNEVGRLQEDIEHWRVKAGAYGKMAADANRTLGAGRDERLRDTARRVAGEVERLRSPLSCGHPGACLGEDEYGEPCCTACDRERQAVQKAQGEWAEQQKLASYVVQGGTLRVERGNVGFVFVGDGGTLVAGGDVTLPDVTLEAGEPLDLSPLPPPAAQL